MSYQAIPNLIVHEVQKAEGIHLSETARHHIERLVMDARRREGIQLTRERDYWKDLYFQAIKKE